MTEVGPDSNRFPLDFVAIASGEFSLRERQLFEIGISNVYVTIDLDRAESVHR